MCKVSNPMKKCPYCGAEYSDDAVLCPIDCTPLDDSTPPKSQPAPTSGHGAMRSPVGVAILVPVVLLSAGYIISANINFDIFWILFGITSIWAGIDAKKIEFKRYKLGAVGPVGLFCLCYLLWTLVFPVYLWVRTKIKNGTAELKDETLESSGTVKRFFRRCSRVTARVAEKIVILIAALKIGFLMLCVEEGWRGHYVWENYRHTLEAKGESLDWKAMIPPMVPDAQNFFGAPFMSEWFVRPSGKTQNAGDFSKQFNYTNTTAAVVIADLLIASTTAPTDPGKSTTILKFDDATSRAGAMSNLESILGPIVFGAQGGAILATKPPNPDQTQPLRIYFESKKPPTVQDLLLFFNGQKSQVGHLTIKPVGTNSHQLLATFIVASDYLRWSNRHQVIFDRIREALTRPYARMSGDYSDPLTAPIPNSDAVRAVAQTLAQRAQCHLLLGQPEKALRELTLLHDLRHLLEGAPTGQPMTMVAAMINAAITELYLNTVADGFRMHAWQEPQLITLQKQLEQIDLTSIAHEALREEQVSQQQMMQTDIAQLITPNLEIRGDPKATLWQKIQNLGPANFTRGFFDLNMFNVAKLNQMAIDSVKPAERIILTEKIAEFQLAAEWAYHHWFPYNLLTAIAVPNYTKAVQTFGRDQTKADEAQIVCALERYHLAHGKYPETLSELMPQFIDHLPHDIIGGQPLKFRQTTAGNFLLYSVGWNGVDDGGQTSLCPYTDGDWVWQ